jgi:hypothetical protein
MQGLAQIIARLGFGAFGPEHRRHLLTCLPVTAAQNEICQ